MKSFKEQRPRHETVQLLHVLQCVCVSQRRIYSEEVQPQVANEEHTQVREFF